MIDDVLCAADRCRDAAAAAAAAAAGGDGSEDGGGAKEVAERTAERRSQYERLAKAEALLAEAEFEKASGFELPPAQVQWQKDQIEAQVRARTPEGTEAREDGADVPPDLTTSGLATREEELARLRQEVDDLVHLKQSGEVDKSNGKWYCTFRWRCSTAGS